MNNIKYTGMDVHSVSVSVEVLDAAGKQVMEATIPTQASAILGIIQGLKGPRCMWPLKRTRMPNGSTSCWRRM